MGWRSVRRTARFVAITLALGGLTAVAPAPRAADAATYVGSVARSRLAAAIVGLAPTPSGRGYWLGAADGSVFPFGDARWYGSARGRRLAKPIVGLAATPTGKGYWLVASDGGVFSYGDARFYGSTGGMRLTLPVVGMATSPTGKGYWLVASDGGVFTFGDARFYGSTGNRRLTAPVVGMTASPTGKGYWLVASDGGVFTFGDARFYGSTGNRRLAAPVVGMARPRHGAGYWLLGRDGGVFTFGAARFYGSAAGALGGEAAAGLTASPRDDGYWIASRAGAVDTGSANGMQTDPNLLPNARERAIAAELVTRINTERAARLRVSLAVDPLLSSSAAAWARYLAMHQLFQHQDLSALLHSSNGRFSEVGENLFGGEGNGIMDAGTAHVVLMHSDLHRANMLLPEERFVGVGVACMNNEMIVVEDFAIPASMQLGSHPIPPLLPIAASNEGGASC